MAYITPNTVTGSDVLTAALWNTQIRDNFEAVRNPVTCEVRLNAGLTYVSGTTFPWQALGWDTSPPASPMWSASDPTKVFIRETAIYLVTLKVLAVLSPVPFYSQVNLSVNGSQVDYNRTYSQGYSNPNAIIAMTLTSQLSLNNGSYLSASLDFDQPAGTKANTIAGSNDTRLCVTRLSAAS